MLKVISVIVWAIVALGYAVGIGFMMFGQGLESVGGFAWVALDTLFVLPIAILLHKYAGKPHYKKGPYITGEVPPAAAPTAPTTVTQVTPPQPKKHQPLLLILGLYVLSIGFWLFIIYGLTGLRRDTFIPFALGLSFATVGASLTVLFRKN